MNDINKDLEVTADGDFNLTDDATTMYQNQSIVIESDKGKIINEPLLGVGITKHLNGPTSIIEINREIKSECKKIKVNVQSVQIVAGDILIKSNEIS